MLTLGVIVTLLFINAFFVAAEFALVKARTSRINNFVISGRLGASVTQTIQGDLEAHLAACQLGITMASLGLGWVGEPFVATLLEPLLHTFGLGESAIHTTAFIVGFLIFSSLHITIGEQVPKTFAIRKAESVSIWVAYPLRFFFLAFYPLNTSLNSISRFILFLFGVKEAPHAEIYSSEEIENIVIASTESGEIKKNKGEMLNNMFKFDQLRVARVMIPFNLVKSLDTALDRSANIAILKATGHSRFPVINSQNDNELLGIVLVKDLFNATLEGEIDPWSNLQKYCRKALLVTESQNVASLFDQMRKKRSHFAVVVDEYGTLVGVITIEDLLEEIVGEIEDETDTDNIKSSIVSIANGEWEVDGLVPLVDLEKRIGLCVDPTLDVNTLSGLIMQRLSRMPEAGDVVVENEFTLTVKQVSKRRVESVGVVIDKVEAAENMSEQEPPK